MILAVLILFGCKGSGIADRLDEIDACCDSDPRLAMSMLDSIDPSHISVKDRHRYDLLTIQSRDNAYIRHTTESLILDAIDY